MLAELQLSMCCTNRSATGIMLRNITFRASFDSISVQWITPKLLPKRYTLKCTCTRFQNESKLEGAIEEGSIPRNSNLVVISPLKSFDSCRVRFKAVYNRLSIDQGIYQELLIPDEGQQAILGQELVRDVCM